MHCREGFFEYPGACQTLHYLLPSHWQNSAQAQHISAVELLLGAKISASWNPACESYLLLDSGFKVCLEIFGFLKFSAYSKKFFSRSRRNAVKRLIRDDTAHSGTDKSGFQCRSSNCKSHLHNLGKQQPVAGRQL